MSENVRFGQMRTSASAPAASHNFPKLPVSAANRDKTTESYPGDESMIRSLLCIAVLLALALAAPAASAQNAKVKFGIDVLRDEGFKSLAGKRVGLIASPSSVDENLAPTSAL